MKIHTHANTSGFTLIELLVVIAIIGLLSSVVLASLNSARVKARDTRRMADIKQIQNALELYASDNNGKYPNVGGLVLCETNLSSFSSLQTALAPYLPTIPLDPSPSGTCAGWGRRYVINSTTNDYKIIAHSPENPSAQNSSMWDPTRDGGNNGGLIDGNSPWAFALYTPALASW